MQIKKIVIIVLVITLILPTIVTPISVANSEEVNNKNNTQVEIEEDKKEVEDLDSKTPVKEIDESNIEDNKKDVDDEDNTEKIDDSKKEAEEENDNIEVRNNDKFIKGNLSLQLKASSNIEEGTYYISSVIDINKTFDIAEQSKVNGARLQLWDKSINKTDNQKFEIRKTNEGYYTIYAKHSGKVLDVDGARKENGTKVQQYESNGTDAQKWIIARNEDNTYSIMSKCNGLYLDIPGGSATNGIKLQVYEGNGSNAQRFRLTKTDEELIGEQTIEDGKYKIKMATNTKIGLDIESKSISNGANVQLWSEPDIITKNQRFEVEYKGEGYYEIKAQHSGKVLDVAGGGTTNGSNVQQYEKNGTDAQKWIIKDNKDGTYSIISKKSGLYLDVKNGTIANGSNVQIYEKNGSNAQKFIFENIEKERCEKIVEEGIYKISTGISSNKVLDIDGGKIENSANLQIWDRSKVQQQKFQLTYKEEGYYEIKAVHSGKVLDVKGGASNNGTNVQQYESNESEAQKWILQRAGNGYYYILSRGAESYLDVAGGVNSNGANLQIYDGNESLSQKFKFEKIQIIDDEEYNIITKLDNNKAIDVDIASSNVQIWTLNRTSKNQRFELKCLGEETYKIICSETGKVLTVRNGNVVQEEYKGTENQKWKIEIAEDGYYYIKSKREGLYLDVFGANPAEGANIHVYEGNKTNAQKFKFNEILVFYGIDVSNWNGIIDWMQVKSSGKVDFAIIRAGYRGYGSNGTLVTDACFERNLMQANAVGIDIGIYFFTQAINESEAIQEADYVVSLLRKYNVHIKYPIAIDTENSGSKTNGKLDYEGRADKLDIATRTVVCKAFCERIKSYGYTPMIYASRDWFYYNLDVSKLVSYEHWVAHYTGSESKVTNYIYPYTMWQYTSEGHVSGIIGDVDRSIGYKKY